MSCYDRSYSETTKILLACISTDALSTSLIRCDMVPVLPLLVESMVFRFVHVNVNSDVTQAGSA